MRNFVPMNEQVLLLNANKRTQIPMTSMLKLTLKGFLIMQYNPSVVDEVFVFSPRKKL